MMTVAEARRVLAHPVFGDTDCIQARDLLRLADRALELRYSDREWPEALPIVESMTASELEEELAGAEWVEFSEATE